MICAASPLRHPEKQSLTTELQQSLLSVFFLFHGAQASAGAENRLSLSRCRAQRGHTGAAEGVDLFGRTSDL